MSYFDTSKRTMVIVDASPVGISAILAQREKDPQQYKVIAYVSRSLTPVEKRYSQPDGSRRFSPSMGNRTFSPIFAWSRI